MDILIPSTHLEERLKWIVCMSRQTHIKINTNIRNQLFDINTYKY